MVAMGASNGSIEDLHNEEVQQSPCGDNRSTVKLSTDQRHSNSDASGPAESSASAAPAQVQRHNSRARTEPNLKGVEVSIHRPYCPYTDLREPGGSSASSEDPTTSSLGPVPDGLTLPIQHRICECSDAALLQRDLLAGFRAPRFQEKLRQLKKQQSEDYPKQLQQLSLSVFADVLPWHGFDGGPSGVANMTQALKPFANEQEIKVLSDQINEALSGHQDAVESDSDDETWREKAAS